MLPILKKIGRTAQVHVPGLITAKNLIADTYFRYSGLLFKAEFGGLRHFDLNGKLLLDIGANRGQSIIAFQNILRDTRIIAFEPNPTLAPQLAKKYPAVRVFSYALGAAEGSIILYEPSYRGCQLDGIASLKQEEAAGWINEQRFYFFDPSKVSLRSHVVHMRTLDSFHLEPALIKLHTQRSEIEILKGARETIDKFRPIIMSAWAWPELVRFLADRSYSFFSYERGKFVKGQPRYMNWFLLPEHVEALTKAGVFAANWSGELQ